jgi:DNA-binding HxlR family transcriptional regulator
MPSKTVLKTALEALSPECADRDRHVDNLSALTESMARFGHDRGDPVRTIQGYLGDRWSSLVMHLLSGGMLRYTELRRLIGVVSAERDISQRVLTLKLRILERDGLIARHVTTHNPPHVEYQLTALGQGAYEHFSALVRWAEQATPPIRSARRDYDRQHPEFMASLTQQGEDRS